MGIKVGAADVLGAVASVGVAAAGVGFVAGKIGEALNPQQTKIAALKADAENRIRTSGVPPVYLKP